jgi:hypothetical protein
MEYGVCRLVFLGRSARKFATQCYARRSLMRKETMGVEAERAGAGIACVRAGREGAILVHPCILWVHTYTSGTIRVLNSWMQYIQPLYQNL